MMDARDVDLIVDRLAQGNPVPWELLGPEGRKRADDALAIKAGKYAEWGDGIRMGIFLNERKRYQELFPDEVRKPDAV